MHCVVVSVRVVVRGQGNFVLPSDARRADSGMGFFRGGQLAPPQQQGDLGSAFSSPGARPPNDIPVFGTTQATYSATLLRLKVPQMATGGGVTFAARGGPETGV